MNKKVMKLIKKIEQHALDSGYVKDGNIDIARMANEYIQMSEKEALNEKERYKKYRGIHRTFKNFFDPDKNSTLKTLGKISDVLGVENFLIEVKQVK